MRMCVCHGMEWVNASMDLQLRCILKCKCIYFTLLFHGIEMKTAPLGRGTLDHNSVPTSLPIASTFPFSFFWI